ncbi:MAG: ABC transporter permease [Candidatus Marinimicrobia bacterium]|jgi:peptide/nickel transport system permease protein|nr:ABC transporter permease [Candidatus Neomarinimicrobiota bacterium]MCK9484828.1 ABC transporter permease [Candidatus Neomarinimicrobiota bacterium]MCK9560723.1 ABC transporter permease [Candidatus Neomarinimicrobiota bacterium]MDD5061549.1 ABC transporter permease [Candidatus Neomarinimicrobiota bacterium]
MVQSFKTIWTNRNCRWGIIILIPILFAAILGVYLTPFNPVSQDLDQVLHSPSWRYLCGTDFYGRDLFSRLIYGSRVTLGLALCASILAIGAGTLLGLMAGFLRGWADRIIMRAVDIFMGFPRFFAVLLIAAICQSGFWATVIVLALFSWMETARLVRAETLTIREALYVKSATALGLNKWRIARTYIFPNLLGIVVTSFTLLIGTLIIVESGLSFLGLGTQEPAASWGTILSQGRIDPFGAWWIATIAGLLIVITVVGFNLLGDGLKQLQDESKL